MLPELMCKKRTEDESFGQQVRFMRNECRFQPQIRKVRERYLNKESQQIEENDWKKITEAYIGKVDYSRVIMRGKI